MYSLIFHETCDENSIAQGLGGIHGFLRACTGAGPVMTVKIEVENPGSLR